MKVVLQGRPIEYGSAEYCLMRNQDAMWQAQINWPDTIPQTLSNWYPTRDEAESWAKYTIDHPYSAGRQKQRTK